MPKNREDELLRRTSFKILSWVFTAGFGVAAVVVLISLIHHPEGGPMIGLAACLFTIALGRRIMGSRIGLGASAVTVVNPLITYTVPYGTVAEVRGGGGGTLNLVTRAGDEIYCDGFGGSVIDSFIRSTDRAAERIEQHVRRGRRSAQQAKVIKRFTISWVADVCTIGALICIITGGIVGF
ncbi:hypothetical protein OHB41_01260 [Streptomyces sp. NBC_01571]|uniref:hypothetical protein n=1 Tax=Streptomyces sp. NBC_01571 TaxID=2975883 RepID=UPI002253E1BB|nr:hypothetical protein [Streptomyces sp. NBC_01571]MCX4571850.1 hypothetical protein [Streptomyces sp. NBC_01571]